MRATMNKSKVSFASIMNGTMLRAGKLALVGFACSFLLVTAQPTKECDKSKCPGPTMYYEDLKCKPIFENPNDCCAVRYNCSNLDGRSTDKCYVNGRVYAIGEHLRDEDRNSPCDIGCYCNSGYENIATFTCAIVDCFHGMTKPGCYHKANVNSCCRGEEVCPENPEDRFKCEVDGKDYYDGEYFSPKDNPELSCVCAEGYKGENVAPFCRTPTCGTELRHNVEIYKNCAPVYYSNQSPRESCSVSSRCQNANDTVIQNPNATEGKAEQSSEDMKCKFGNLTMNIGDELNQATDYSSVCVKCVCEVPPLPTCQRLPDEECDVTNHPPFTR